MKILVVDDEKDVQPLFQQRFRKEIRTNEIEMEFLLSGEEALDYIDKNGYQNSLILSDINMPGMSGLELLDRIRKKYTPPPPIIMMISAYGDQENRDSAHNLGAEDFFTKPLNFDLLKEKIKALTP
ncbi:MAG: two-component system chemotaxis response regulator CheY [Cyclobacteriaceae bacterium]|jgi:two-component system chemotaxis response regulator CheY